MDLSWRLLFNWFKSTSKDDGDDYHFVGNVVIFDPEGTTGGDP